MSSEFWSNDPHALDLAWIGTRVSSMCTKLGVGNWLGVESRGLVYIEDVELAV